MAKAVINLQKESGGIVKISPVDGTGVTEVTVPESGNLVSVNTVVTDNAIARYDGATGKLQNSGVVIDDNGNVGIGVTPSAWGSAFMSIEGGNSSSSQNWIGLQTNVSTLKAGTNSYYDGAYYRYKLNNAASMQDMSQGGFQWLFAPSGTAGNAITWTTAMTLGSNGNLLVGTTTDNGVDKLQVNGSISANNISSKNYFQIVNPILNQWYQVTGLSTNMEAHILSVFAEYGGNKLSEILAVTNAFSNTSIVSLTKSGLAGYLSMCGYRWNGAQFEVRSIMAGMQVITIFIK